MKHKFTTKAIMANFHSNQGALSSWKAIVQHTFDIAQRPVRVFDAETIEECEASEADLWAVYLKISKDGQDAGLNPSYWIADFKTKESSDNFSFLLELLLKSRIK